MATAAKKTPNRPTPPNRPVDPEAIKAAAKAKMEARRAAARKLEEENPELTVEEINARLMAMPDDNVPEREMQARLARAAKIEAKVAIKRASGGLIRGNIGGGIR